MLEARFRGAALFDWQTPIFGPRKTRVGRRVLLAGQPVPAAHSLSWNLSSKRTERRLLAKQR
jgi:hypothetical protein